jgi:hypothetical protein
MTLGSVFALISNDGKADKVLHATKLLNDRLAIFRKERMDECMNSCLKHFNNPDGVYNESDKALFMRNPAQFCRANEMKELNPTLMDITKSHNIFINQFYKPFVATSHIYDKNTDRKGLTTFGREVTFTITKVGSWFSDMGVHIKLTGLKAKNIADKCKYAAWLGHRLFKQVKFSVNNKEMDTYTSEEMNKHYQFDVPAHKKKSWMKCMGQEIPHMGYLTPDPVNNEFREVRWISDGPQTLKNEHAEVELFIPLLFWFRKIEQAFPHCMLPWGQIDISITLANLGEIAACADYGGGGEFIAPKIEKFDLYVNHIESLPQIVNIYKQSYSYNLVRIHRRFIRTVNSAYNDVWLQELKYPIESLVVGIRPLENLESVDNWWKNTKVTPKFIKQPVIVDIPVANTIGINFIEYNQEESMTETLSFKVKDIDLFPEFPIKLYSDYIPYTRGNAINGPEWDGWYLLPFNLKPGERDPSGHYNASKNREIYLSYKSQFISPGNPAQLIVLADVFNFLLIDNDDAVMRYTT